MKLKRSIKPFFHRLKVGSEDPSVLCSLFLLRNVAKSQIQSFLSDQNFELGRNDITVLDESREGVGKCCLCRPIIEHLTVDSLTGSLIRTVKFQIVAVTYTLILFFFFSCNCWAVNAIIDGHCQLL